MELIIIKSGERYIRVKDGEYLLVQIDKASVFPMDKLNVARGHEKNLVADRFANVSLKKLVLSEEELDQ